MRPWNSSKKKKKLGASQKNKDMQSLLLCKSVHSLITLTPPSPLFHHLPFSFSQILIVDPSIHKRLAVARQTAAKQQWCGIVLDLGVFAPSFKPLAVSSLY
jgi:hypothetical protein